MKAQHREPGQHPRALVRPDPGAISNPPVSSSDVAATDATQAVAELAYELWLARGCPNGSPEEDWFNAEEQMKSRKRPSQDGD